MLVDSSAVSDLDSALMQQPEMSKDGRYIAITLRGSKRETGIWDLKKKTWTRTGEGCQINWAPTGDEIYWVHPTGNGGSRVLHMAVKAGKPAKSDAEADSLTLIDIPGRRSHEYFPQLSADGKWLVWAATQRGHDHDIADYEIYLWKVGAEPQTATRLTYHSGNDRWPDIFHPRARPARRPARAAASSGGKTHEGGCAPLLPRVFHASTEDEASEDDDSGASRRTRRRRDGAVPRRGSTRRRRTSARPPQSQRLLASRGAGAPPAWRHRRRRGWRC